MIILYALDDGRGVEESEGAGGTELDVLMWLYSAALGVGLALSSPWWLTRMVTTERYREGLRERLGRVPARLREAVRGFAENRRVVWVHAVSVGEVLAVSRLVAELEAGLSGGGEAWRVVVSTTTKTGQKLARERFGAERVFYFPLDFAWAVRAYLRVLRPAAVVLAESELWPRMLYECRRAGVPVAVVNARVSDRSFRRGVKVRRVWGRVLRGVSLWLAQSEEDARRLAAMGARSERVRAVGNLKYDVRAPKQSRVAELIREMAGRRAIIVAGSTVGSGDRHGSSEEEMILEAWQDLPQRDSGVLLVLAPRHPERFPFAASVVDTFYERASELESRLGPNGFPIEADVVVLDTIGDLAAVYGLAHVAFVGGSLVKRGGHNPLEPAQFGVPVVMGPSFENFRDVVGKMVAAEAIRIVGGGETRIPFGNDNQKSRPSSNGGGETQIPFGKDKQKGNDKGPDESHSKGNTETQIPFGNDNQTASSDDLRGELEAAFVELLSDREGARAMGQRGLRVFEEQQGATARTVVALYELVGVGAKATVNS